MCFRVNLFVNAARQIYTIYVQKYVTITPICGPSRMCFKQIGVYGHGNVVYADVCGTNLAAFIAPFTFLFFSFCSFISFS